MKNELRIKYKQLRQDLTLEARNNLSKNVQAKILNHFNFTNKKVSIFLPIEHLNELNTWPIIEHIISDYYLPVMVGDKLKHIHFESKDQLKKNSWGILEPQYGIEIQANQFEFVIVPLLAFDNFGNRVGYGKGFYDQFLVNCSVNCVFIGVSFFESEPTEIERIKTDIPLHYCITPNTIYKF